MNLEKLLKFGYTHKCYDVQFKYKDKKINEQLWVDSLYDVVLYSFKKGYEIEYIIINFINQYGGDDLYDLTEKEINVMVDTIKKYSNKD